MKMILCTRVCVVIYLQLIINVALSYTSQVEAAKEGNCARPLPPTPEEKLAATSPDEEGLYEVPGKLQGARGIRQTTGSPPPVSTCTHKESYRERRLASIDITYMQSSVVAEALGHLVMQNGSSDLH